jgi:hypothetical protein
MNLLITYFFTCPVIIVPQGNLLPTYGLAEFWKTCLKLPLIDRSF